MTFSWAQEALAVFQAVPSGFRSDWLAGAARFSLCRSFFMSLVSPTRMSP